MGKGRYYFKEIFLLPTVRITDNAIPIINERHIYIDIMWLRFVLNIYKSKKELNYLWDGQE